MNEYSKYLTNEKIEELNNMDNVFVLKDSKYKIYNNDKINICLDINSFIKENNLMTDNGLKDIDISAKIYVKFLIDNKDNVIRLVLSTILRPIIAYLVKPGDDVFTNGMVDDITNKLSHEYNIKYEKPYESKEAEMFNLAKNIIGNKIYKVLFNHDKISTIYDSYDFDIDDMTNEINHEYHLYEKCRDKVFYSDKLYAYQTINYDKQKAILKSIIDELNENEFMKEQRIKSIERCTDNLIKNMMLFDYNDEQMIKYYSDLVKSTINKLNDNNIDDIYLKMLELENRLKVFTDKMWCNKITKIDEYNQDKSFNFIVGNSKDKLVEANLLSSKIMENTDAKLKHNYGFIYSPENIVYATSNDILVRKGNIENINTIVYNNNKIEIDNQKDSKIMTPELIARDNIKNKSFGNIVLFDPKIIGVFAIYENKTDYDYEKAVELSSNMELPLIEICKNKIKKVEILNFDVEKKKEKEIKKIEVPKQKTKLSEKIKNFKNSVLYEEEEIKKVI